MGQAIDYVYRNGRGSCGGSTAAPTAIVAACRQSDAKRKIGISIDLILQHIGVAEDVVAPAQTHFRRVPLGRGLSGELGDRLLPAMGRLGDQNANGDNAK